MGGVAGDRISSGPGVSSRPGVASGPGVASANAGSGTTGATSRATLTVGAGKRGALVGLAGLSDTGAGAGMRARRVIAASRLGARELAILLSRCGSRGPA